MFKNLKFLLLGLLFSTQILAQTVAPANKPTEASIKQVFELSNTRDMLKNIEAQLDGMMKNMMQQALKGEPVSAEQQKVLDKFREKLLVIYKQEMTWEKLEPMFIEIYRNALSQDDVDGIITFYRSPAGQAYIKKMPLVMQQSMGMVQKLLQPMMEKIQPLEKEMTEEMQKISKKKE